jgi:integrase/recombinase XerD
MKPTITLKPLMHRGAEHTGIYFKNNPGLNILIRSKAGGTWSQTNKCWYIPLTKLAFEKLKTAVGNTATIDTSSLKKYLEEKKKTKSPANSVIKKPVNLPAKNIQSQQLKPIAGISPINKHVLPAMEQLLKLKAFSPSTIRTYLNEMTQLLQTIKDIPADELTPELLKRYLVYCYEKLQLKENTLHSRINAMKFYYEKVLKREKFFWEIPRPKKQFILPKIFNHDEVASIINSVTNKKHKTMLMLSYSAGLRVSEVVSLKTYNIDSSRMTILIQQAKGKKDRIVTLSPVLLVMLRDYALQYKPDKKGYLFEGINKGTAYSTRSLQEVLQAAKKKAGVMKPGSIHSLRHSFATHLIEKGTDVTMIQKLMGHNDIKTTMLYLHTSNKDLLKIISPLDDLKLK